MDFQTLNPSLIEIVRVKNLAAVRVALQRSLDLETTDYQLKTPLIIATENQDFEIASYLVKSGASVNAQDVFYNTPFLVAAAEGYTSLVLLMLKFSPDFSICNRYGGNALTSACERGHTEIVREILKSEYIFDIDHKDDLGWTPLLEAIILGDGSQRYVEIVELLVKGGANPRAQDTDGKNCLDHARRKNFSEIVKILKSPRHK